MRVAFLACITLLAASLAGCFQLPGSTVETEEQPYVITRVVRVNVDGDNIERLVQIADDPTLMSEYRYDFLDPQIVLRVNVDVDPKSLTFTYTDREGLTQTRPVSLLTGAPWLNPGMTVTIPSHLFSGGVLKDLKGNVLADRTVKTPEWWTVGGYPIGVHMAPGAQLAYDLTSEARQRFSLTDVKSSDRDFTYFLDSAVADFAMSNRATLTLTQSDVSETITAEERHTAWPLVVALEGQLDLPMEISFTGRNLTTGHTIEGGFETRRGTGVDYRVDGKLWWNDSSAPVRFDLDAATSQAHVDVIAWLLGMPEAEDEFSCASKSRLDQCTPKEVPLEEITQPRSAEARQFNLDGFGGMPDAAILRDLEQFLADDLRPGDEISYRVNLVGSELPGYDERKNYPERIEIESLTRVLGSETVTVKAGTFETYKVSQVLRFRVVTPEWLGDDGMKFKRLDINQRVVDSSMWLDKSSFVVVRSIATTPFDVGKLADDVLDALDAKLWSDAPIERLTSTNVELTTTNTQGMELASMSGKSRLAPWMLVGGLPLFFLAEEGLPAYLVDEPGTYSTAPTFAYS